MLIGPARYMPSSVVQWQSEVSALVACIWASAKAPLEDEHLKRMMPGLAARARDLMEGFHTLDLTRTLWAAGASVFLDALPGRRPDSPSDAEEHLY